MSKALRIPAAMLAVLFVVFSAGARQTTRGYELEYIETPGTTTGVIFAL